MGDYTYTERQRIVSEVSASSIEIVQFNLSTDTCNFELISSPLAQYDQRVHKDQWSTLTEAFWPPSKKLVTKITNWKSESIIPTRFRVLEDGGHHCKCHFHGFQLDEVPWVNLKIDVHTVWLDSQRRLESDFIDLSFIIEETEDLSNDQLLPRREELMKSLEQFKPVFEDYLSSLVRLMLRDETLTVSLQPIEVEDDYDHECYSWSFMMKGVIR